MSEIEKLIADTIKEAMPKMSDFDKGYLLGKVEQIAADHPAAKEQPDQNTDSEKINQE